MTEVVRARLVADGTVNGLVSDRVFVEELAQDCAMPAIVIEMLDDEPQNTLTGEQTLANEQWTIECWASTYTAAKALAAAVESAMSAAGSDFTAVRIDKDVIFDNQAKIKGVTLDYSLWI